MRAMVAWRARHKRTVDVMSDEQTSQTYFVPPSVPRAPVFFLMTPMVPRSAGCGEAGEQASSASSSSSSSSTHRLH